MEEVEEEMVMRPDGYYIDEEKKIRLDKVVLGFDLDPFNDSINEAERAVREKRQAIEQDLMSDSFYA